MMVGRFAPSPTGRLHLGNAAAALLGWLQVRARGGRFLLRVEDLDAPRCRPEHVDALFEDLRYLGLDYDGEPIFQSARLDRYEAALDRLRRMGRVFPCWCSRADIARIAAAPHAGEEGPVYPGTCRPAVPLQQPLPEAPTTGGCDHSGGEAFRGASSGLPTPNDRTRPPSSRFRVGSGGEVCFEDRLLGRQCQDVEAAVGDFVLRRADAVFNYQLAVVVDDAETGVTDVLRGVDLLPSTARQLQLFEALGHRPPRYAHVPLLVDLEGRRLSKREGDLTLRALRESGVPGPRVVALLAKLLSLGTHDAVAPRDLVAGFTLDAIPHENVAVDAAELLRALR